MSPGEGARWSNYHRSASVDDNFTLLDAMIMLLIDTAIHLIITWYLDNVRPGEFGVPKPLYFCFTVSNVLCPSLFYFSFKVTCRCPGLSLSVPRPLPVGSQASPCRRPGLSL